MIKNLFRIGSFCLLMTFLAPMMASAQGNQPLIIDNAKLLTPEQYEELKFILNGYLNEKKVEFVFFSTKSLKGKTVDVYSQQIIRNFGIGRKGLNTGLLFFIALEEKKVTIQLGHGLEWSITDEKKAFILDQIKAFMRDGEFYEGAKEAFIQCYELIKELPWTVGYESFKELGYSLKRSMNNVVSFDGTPVTKNILHNKSSGPQFSSKYFITIRGENDKTARLYYSLNMIPMVEKILAGGTTRIYARVTRTGPVRLDLMGIDGL